MVLVDQLEEWAYGAKGVQVISDRDREQARYDAWSRQMLDDLDHALEESSVPGHLREPYDWFHAQLEALITRETVVLEIGAGSGQHTLPLAELTDLLVTLDISVPALTVGALRGGSSVRPVCADMEALPIGDGSVDIVVSAGSLSYGEPDLVDAEIRRVLRPGGALVVVDSLNHNPFYRLNRWLHYRKGQTSLSTLKRMPDQRRIARLMQGFGHVRLRRYGSFVFLYPPLRRFLGDLRAQNACVVLDREMGRGRNAFKFVLVGTDYMRRPSGG